MAWNGSDKEKVKVEGQGQERGKHRSSASGFNYKALVAGLVVVIGGGLAAWFVMRPSERDSIVSPDVAKPSAIAEVKPQVVTREEAAVATVEPKAKRFWEVDASQTNGFTDVMLRKWRAAHRPPPAYTNDSSRYAPPPKYAIFKHYSENVIAAMLTMEPGETLVGTPTYRGIDNDFMRSCEEPIIPTEEDDEYSRDLKRQMNEAKIEIRQRMADGEKLEDILCKTHEEYQQLARYKFMLNDQLREYANDPEHSDQDLDDFVNSANKLLEQKGIAPLKLGIITRKRLLNLKNNKEESK